MSWEKYTEIWETEEKQISSMEGRKASVNERNQDWEEKQHPRKQDVYQCDHMQHHKTPDMSKDK